MSIVASQSTGRQIVAVDVGGLAHVAREAWVNGNKFFEQSGLPTKSFFAALPPVIYDEHKPAHLTLRALGSGTSMTLLDGTGASIRVLDTVSDNITTPSGEAHFSLRETNASGTNIFNLTIPYHHAPSLDNLRNPYNLPGGRASPGRTYYFFWDGQPSDVITSADRHVRDIYYDSNEGRWEADAHFGDDLHHEIVFTSRNAIGSIQRWLYLGGGAHPNPPPIINSFTTNKAQHITNGESVVFSWNVSGADRIEIHVDGTTVLTESSSTGTHTLPNIGANKTVRLKSVKRGATTISATREIRVSPAASIALSAPSSARSGSRPTIGVHTQNAAWWRVSGGGLNVGGEGDVASGSYQLPTAITADTTIVGEVVDGAGKLTVQSAVVRIR